MITLSEILIAVAVLANGAKGRETMSKNATKVQDNTVFFMQGDQPYGIGDTAGNFSRL